MISWFTKPSTFALEQRHRSHAAKNGLPVSLPLDIFDDLTSLRRLNLRNSAVAWESEVTELRVWYIYLYIYHENQPWDDTFFFWWGVAMKLKQMMWSDNHWIAVVLSMFTLADSANLSGLSIKSDWDWRYFSGLLSPDARRKNRWDDECTWKSMAGKGFT